MIRFSCPCCGHAIKAPDEAAGKTGKCKCGEPVRVPVPPKSPGDATQPAVTPFAVLPPVKLPDPEPNPVSIPAATPAQTPAPTGKPGQTFATIVTILIAVPFFLCCLGVLSNSGSHHSSLPPEPRVPARWDMEKLKRDADEVARDPSKTIFIPKDGSQPILVPNPYPPPPDP